VPNQEPTLEDVRKLILATRDPSVGLVQRHFLLGFARASELVRQLEGDIVTALDESGWRQMLDKQSLNTD